MTYRHEETSHRTRNVAIVAVSATVALTAIAALTAAPLLVPIAIALPYAAMTVVEREIERDRAHA